jgi:hypothetical protein
MADKQHEMPVSRTKCFQELLVPTGRKLVKDGVLVEEYARALCKLPIGHKGAHKSRFQLAEEAE